MMMMAYLRRAGEMARAAEWVCGRGAALKAQLTALWKN